MTSEPEPNTRAGEALKAAITQDARNALADQYRAYGLDRIAQFVRCGDADQSTHTPALLALTGAFTRPLPQPSELVERLLSAFAGGLVEVPDKANPRGYTIQYLPAIAMQSALRTCGLDEAAAQLAKLQADGDKLAVALELIRDTGPAILTVVIAREIATQALTEWKDRA